MQWHRNLSVASTFARLMSLRRPVGYWRTKAGRSELIRDLEGPDEEGITRGLLTLVSMCWGSGEGSDIIESLSTDYFEHHLFSRHHGVWDAALWGWGLSRSIYEFPPASTAVLDRILSLWLAETDKWDTAPFAMAKAIHCFRDWSWKPDLTDSQRRFLRKQANRTINNPDEISVVVSATFVAIITRNVWSEAELLERVHILEDAKFMESDDYATLVKTLQHRPRS